MEPNIIGYHSNTEDKANKFVNNGELAISPDTYYLGKGMYFWDNIGNAEYWAAEKIRKSKKEKKPIDKVLICRANVILKEPILDLTDSLTIEDLKELWISYCEKKKETKKRQLLGTIIDILMDFFPVLQEMKVSKCHGDYSHHKMAYFLDKYVEKLYITNNIKTIYCVRCKTRIADQRIFDTILSK